MPAETDRGFDGSGLDESGLDDGGLDESGRESSEATSTVDDDYRPLTVQTVVRLWYARRAATPAGGGMEPTTPTAPINPTGGNR